MTKHHSLRVKSCGQEKPQPLFFNLLPYLALMKFNHRETFCRNTLIMFKTKLIEHQISRPVFGLLIILLLVLVSISKLNPPFFKELHAIKKVKVLNTCRKTYTNQSLPSLMSISGKDKNQKTAIFAYTQRSIKFK